MAVSKQNMGSFLRFDLVSGQQVPDEQRMDTRSDFSSSVHANSCSHTWSHRVYFIIFIHLRCTFKGLLKCPITDLHAHHYKQGNLCFPPITTRVHTVHAFGQFRDCGMHDSGKGRHADMAAMPNLDLLGLWNTIGTHSVSFCPLDLWDTALQSPNILWQ